MRTTVVIPLYNAGELIHATLRSVFDQTRAADVLVVDDGSTDGSDRALELFPKARFLRNPTKGANAARRFGIEQVRTPFVTVLDQDDLWHPDHLARLETLLDKHAETSAAIGGVVRFTTPDLPLFSLTNDSATPIDPWQSFPINRICTPSQVLMRTQSLIDEGGWASHVVGVADFHAWLRLSARAPLCQDHAATVGYRQHAQSYSSTLRRTGRHQYFERFLDAAMEVLPLRVQHKPEDRNQLEARLACGRALAKWIRAIEQESAENPREAALALENALSAQPRPLARGMLAQALYFTKGFSNGAGPLRKGIALVKLAAACPASCTTLRRELLRRLWDRRSRE